MADSKRGKKRALEKFLNFKVGGGRNKSENLCSIQMMKTTPLIPALGYSWIFFNDYNPYYIGLRVKTTCGDVSIGREEMSPNIRNTRD